MMNRRRYPRRRFFSVDNLQFIETSCTVPTCLSLWEKFPEGAALSVSFADSSPKGRAKRALPRKSDKIKFDHKNTP